MSCYPLPVNFGWSQIETTVASKLVPFKKYKWRILAVTVFLVIFSPVVVVTYLSYFEPRNLYVDDDQWTLSLESTGLRSPTPSSFPIYSNVVLESIDDMQGTAHLRADLRMQIDGKRMPLFDFISERLKTDETHRNPYPVEVLFGPFTIRDEFGNFENLAHSFEFWEHAIFLPGLGRWGRRPTENFSESAPTSTQADVLLEQVLGLPWWWYPFDEYVIAARVDCVVVATPDREKYSRIPSDRYILESKLPNFIVRSASAKDFEDFIRASRPDIKDKELKEITKSYRKDFWRDGIIRLVLTRPLFPRFLAVFFGIVALAWIAVVAKVSDPKQLSLNVFGYFLALWAIRSTLAAGAPTGPLFMDYATLGLYALLIAVVAARLIWIRKT